MAGTAAAAGIDIAQRSTYTPSAVNTFRIAAVADRLALHVWSSSKIDTIEFLNLCLSLARGIDYAVANSEVPGRVQDLPRLLKQVCQRNNDSLLQAAIMVLMISVKNACKNGWFPTEDSGELLALADEIGSSFCTVREMNTEAINSLQIISTVMARFYPRMKLGQILAFLEVKPGYGTYILDFHISKNAKPSAEEKIRLFVAQTDNAETSSCIITPPLVSFLLNGKGVDRRTNVAMDTGPQFPTEVTRMLKFGTNLLQAVGQFNGNHIIVVAYMSMISNPDRPALQDYVQHDVAAPDSDTEIIEGPSRISLNCPISFRRIRTPVKGHSCKHLQCFDLDNFVDMNSRRPSWRCPHCNQCVSYVDIRIDQNMVKVLKEVGDNVVDVIISPDGSWKAVAESNGNTDQPHDKSMNCPQGGSVLQEASSITNSPDILDLTVGDDVMDVELTYGTQDQKPNLANLQSQPGVENGATSMGMNSTCELNQNAAPIEDDFWSGIFWSTYGSGVLTTDGQFVGGDSGSATASNSMLSPVLTDAVTPTLNREPEAFHESALIATPTPQSQVSAPTNLPLQQSQFGTSMAGNEYGRIPSIAGHHINRTPIAVQALPARNLTSVPQQRSSFNPFPQGPALASQAPPVPSGADGFNTVSTSMERQQQYSRVHLNTLPAPQMMSSSLRQHPVLPNWNRQDRTFTSSQAALSQLRSAYRVPPRPITEHQNSRQQQPLNGRVPHGMRQSPSLIRPSGQSPLTFPRNQIQQGGTQSGAAQTSAPGSSQRMMHSAQRPPHMARQPPPVPVPSRTTGASSPSFPMNVSRFSASFRDQGGNTGATLQTATVVDTSADLPGEQDWQPTGRMRGSLKGRAYSDALSQIIQPTPPVQAAARLPLNVTSPPPGISAPLHVLAANSRIAHASQPVSFPPTESTGVAASSGVLPEMSSGMQ